MKSDDELRRTKITLIGVIFSVAGIALIVLGKWLISNNLHAWTWLHNIPFSELGATLFGIGVVSTAYDYYTRKDEEENAVRRLRETLKQEAPVMRDAVIEGFAFQTEDLRRVATPELLDQLAENSLGLRFGDATFAREVYGDIRDQAIKAAERWYDARVNISLGIPRGSASGATPLFDVVVRWEYTVIPKHRFRRFVAVSDRRRYDELAAEAGDTSVWFKAATGRQRATSRRAFNLVQFTVGDRECPIQRHEDETSQTYVADLGEQAVSDGRPVVVSFTYRTQTSQTGHVLHFDIDRPTRGLDVEITYDDCGIDRLRVFDFVSKGQGARVSAEPDGTGKVLRFGYDGWLFPRAGLVFVWRLERERAAAMASNDHDKTHHAIAA